MKRMKRPRKAAFFLGDYGRKENRAQTILEYAAVIACVVAALLAMQVYIKRGMQGRLRQVADELGQQYAPMNTEGNSTLSYSSSTTVEVITLSERELTLKYYGYPTDPYADGVVYCQDLDSDGIGDCVDLDGDGILEKDVFATETKSTLHNAKTTQKGEEKIGELEPFP